jgi:dTDP-4-amino-4,6-dideoxygalactose transaminase
LNPSLETNRIQTRNYFAGNILIHPAYKHLDNYINYPNSNKVLDKVFFIGCSPSINKDMINYVKDHLYQFQESEHMNGKGWYGAEL